MEIVRYPSHSFRMTGERVAVRVDRQTLAKRRWHGVADDGREFGFDLEHALADGDTILAEADKHYVLAQEPETLLALRIADCGLRIVAEVAWKIGNLHFQIEISDEKIRVADDPALRQLFKREQWPFAECKAVFRPITGGHSHEH